MANYFAFDNALFDFNTKYQSVKFLQETLIKAQCEAKAALQRVNVVANVAINSESEHVISLTGSNFRRCNLEFNMNNRGEVSFVGEVGGDWSGIVKLEG